MIWWVMLALIVGLIVAVKLIGRIQNIKLRCTLQVYLGIFYFIAYFVVLFSL